MDRFIVPRHLEVEEQAVFEQAAAWYGRLFGDRRVELYLHECEQPTVSARRGIRIGGWVDLTVVVDDGTCELRQIDLWGRRPPVEDPLEFESVWVAILRLARWVGARPFRVSWTDLLRGERRERMVDLAAELEPLTERFERHVEIVRTRTATPEARPGGDCGACTNLRRCPAHPDSD